MGIENSSGDDLLLLNRCYQAEGSTEMRLRLGVPVIWREKRNGHNGHVAGKRNGHVTVIMDNITEGGAAAFAQPAAGAATVSHIYRVYKANCMPYMEGSIYKANMT